MGPEADLDVVGFGALDQGRIEDIVESLRDESQVAQSRLAQAQYKIQELQQKLQLTAKPPHGHHLLPSDQTEHTIGVLKTATASQLHPGQKWETLF